jgi:hypothetical protein
MINHTIFQTVSASCRYAVPEPNLSELLRDPMTLALMKADRVDRGALEVLIAGARENLRWHCPN